MNDKVRKIMIKNGVIVGYIFGSYGKDRANSLSDLDIAIVLRGDLSDKEAMETEQDIQKEIGRATGIDRVDLVNLRRTDNPVLRYSAIIEGNPIVAENSRLKKYLERMAVREFEDTRYLRSISYKILKRKAQSYVPA